VSEGFSPHDSRTLACYNGGMTDVTQILAQMAQGAPSSSADQLVPLMYDELRKLAAASLAQKTPGQILQATALVHDAYIRLVDSEKARHWNSRGHFFSAAADAMRRIHVEQAFEIANGAGSFANTANVPEPRGMTLLGLAFLSAVAIIAIRRI